MSGYLILNNMIIKLQKVCLTSICNENKSCKGHHTYTHCWHSEYMKWQIWYASLQ